MRHFIVFYQTATRPDGTNYWTERLGSDGIAYPDNRLSRANMERLAHEIAAKRERCQGFRLARGNRLDSLFFLDARVKPTWV